LSSKNLLKQIERYSNQSCKTAKAKQAELDEVVKRLDESEFVKKMEEDIAIAESEEQNATENKTEE
ncbi:MAG: hypothetical protein K2O62_04415, partial [Clostridia bacterium]|nr:hypothetical protein [Clostridia bacterium]